MADENAAMSQKLRSVAPMPESLVDLTLRNLLMNTPSAFRSYVNHRLWGIGTQKSNGRISAERLGHVIKTFELSGKIPSELEGQINEGIKANPEYYLFDYKHFNYFLHLFDAKNDLMLVARKPKTEENYCFRDILDPTYKPGDKKTEEDEEWKPLNGTWYGLPAHKKRKADEIIETAMETAGIPTANATATLNESKN